MTCRTARMLLWLLLLIVTAGASALLTWRIAVGVSVSSPPSTSTHAGPSIEQVRQLSELVTLRVDVADVQETNVQGLLGGMRVALVVKGDFLLGVDLERARFQSVNETGKSAILVLPVPQRSSPRVDHARTRVVQVTSEGLWAAVPGDGQSRARVLDLAYGEAQQTIAAAAADPQLSQRARRQAEQVLGAFFKALGWSITIRWAE